ncbi:electron transfer flavoprotein alpha subunit [Polaromonas sp. CG_9.7]|jgi:electron transfer flavoprotein alpha subunit|nr:electron transfer flavoprotein alpha subunit [Polaromonas sp. CG_9.7]MDH6185106.1 electron transfer flavoprotein alpha subunit [Polaromonas sp. CG_23.6]
MKDYKVIVSINRYAEAATFSVADYGMEAALSSTVLELIVTL